MTGQLETAVPSVVRRASGAVPSPAVVLEVCQRLAARLLGGPFVSGPVGPVNVVTIHNPGRVHLDNSARSVKSVPVLPCPHTGTSATRWFQFVVLSVRTGTQ